MQHNLDITTEANNVTNSILTMSRTAPGLVPVWLIGLLILLLLIVVVALLGRYLQSDSAKAAAPVEAGLDPLAAEREKVLKLLDAGKITAQESADLLNALGHATPLRAGQPAPDIARPRKLVLIGGALLLVGFFLPWFSIDLGAAMSQAMGQMGQSFGMSMPPNFNLHTGTHNIAGGDIGYGLGWIILLLGLAAAVLPYLAANLAPGTLQKTALVGLGIGSLILLYLLSDLIRYVNVGIFVVLAGYAMEFIGTLKQRAMLQR